MKVILKYNSILDFFDDKYTKECSLTSLDKSRLMRSIRRRARRYYKVEPDGPDSSLVIIDRKELQTLRRCAYIAPEMICEDLLLNRNVLQVPPERKRSGYRYGAMRFALLHLAKSIGHVTCNYKQCA